MVLVAMERTVNTKIVLLAMAISYNPGKHIYRKRKKFKVLNGQFMEFLEN